MKTTKQISALLMIALMLGFGANLSAQNKSELEKEQKQKQAEMQAQLERKQHEEELKKVLEESKKIQESQWIKQNEDHAKRIQESIEKQQKSFEVWQKSFDKSNHNFLVAPDIRIEGLEGEAFKSVRPYVEGLYYINDASTLEISKELEDVDYENEFKYEVPNTSRSISFSISGELEDGEMTITLTKPNGKKFQEVEISPLANITWNQTLRWEEKDADQFAGTWIISIAANGATGHYRTTVRNR